MTLVRHGDPQAALVLVIGQLENVEASTQLAALLSARLATTSLRIEVRQHVGAVTMVAPVDSVVTVRFLARAMDDALRTPVGADETNQPTYQRHWQRLQLAMRQSIPSAERNGCLGAASAENGPGAGVEAVRHLSFSEDRARWGVVGPPALVEAVDGALRQLAPWPRASVGIPAWPAQDLAIFVAGHHQLPHVDFVWRTPLARKVMAAWRELRSTSNPVREVLAASPTPMHLDRIEVAPQMIGGCLGLSISQDPQVAPATIDELTTATRVVIEQLRRFAQQRPDLERATLAVVEQPDPLRAAELATLLAISTDAEATSDRFRAEIDVGSESAITNPTSEQRRTLAEVVAPHSATEAMPLVHAVERGQGNLYVLIASPCATWNESRRTVGATGLLLRVLASRYREVNQVSLEPWITANGVGLVAHSGRISVEETPEEQASRVGEVLGRVLATAPFDAGDLWNVRSESLARLGPSPRPGLFHALLALSPHYPGLVLPEGTYASIEAISMAELRERRAQLLRLPLRLAVLENDGVRQGDALRQALMRWLSIFRTEVGQCPSLAEPESIRATETRIESRSLDPDDAAVTLALSLPVDDTADEAHAELLQWLLNRPSGWLAQRLREGNIVATSDARVVGGTNRRGLIVAIGATPSSVDAATAAIRGLFQELGAASLPQPSRISDAILELRRANLQSRMDPRMRLQDLWLSHVRFAGLSESSLREYLRRACAGSNIVLVRYQRATSEPTARGRGKQ